MPAANGRCPAFRGGSPLSPVPPARPSGISSKFLRRRWRGVQVLIIPAKVQGEGAAQDLVRGIRVANSLSEPPDVLVVGRGGGSLEDLWCFNEEPVVRAIHASRIPVVSAVGHEIDVTSIGFGGGRAGVDAQ